MTGSADGDLRIFRPDGSELLPGPRPPRREVRRRLGRAIRSPVPLGP